MRRRLATVVVSFALLAAGCTSSGGGDAPSTSAQPPASSGGSAADPAVAALAAKVRSGITGLTSAHLDVDAGALGGTIAGHVTFDKGATTASDLMIDQGSGTIEVITVDGTSYAKLPAAHNTSGKPWVRVSADSGNEFVRALAGLLTLTNAPTSLGGVSDLLSSAVTSVKDAGTAKVRAVTAEHYELTIDPSRASGDLKSALALAGSTALPVELWLDAKGRPVKVLIAIPLGQQKLPLTVDVSDFDAPLTITAPPADQIDEG